MAYQTVVRVPTLASQALFPDTSLMKTRNTKIMKNLKKLLKCKPPIFSNRQHFCHHHIIHPHYQLVIPVSPVLFKYRK
jgi:hypothetical protein